MARGNERDLARAKAQKKLEQSKKGKKVPGALSVQAQNELNTKNLNGAVSAKREREAAEIAAKLKAEKDAEDAAELAVKRENIRLAVEAERIRAKKEKDEAEAILLLEAEETSNQEDASPKHAQESVPSSDLMTNGTKA